MLKKLVKLAAYGKAPLKTFAFLHPVKALKWGAAFLLIRKVFGGGRKEENKRARRQRST